jgi:hypothetical protein
LRTLNLKKLPSILGNVIDKIKNNFFEQINHFEAPESKRTAPDIEKISFYIQTNGSDCYDEN